MWVFVRVSPPCHFSFTFLFDKKKALYILMKPITLFTAALLVSCLSSILHTPKSWTFYARFSKSLISWAFLVNSISNSFCVMWGRNQNSFFWFLQSHWLILFSSQLPELWWPLKLHGRVYVIYFWFLFAIIVLDEEGLSPLSLPLPLSCIPGPLFPNETGCCH